MAKKRTRTIILATLLATLVAGCGSSSSQSRSEPSGLQAPAAKNTSKPAATKAANDEEDEDEHQSNRPAAELGKQPGDSDQVRRGIAACNIGNLDGCNYAGAALVENSPTAADVDRALLFFEHTCRKGSPNGCMAIGFVYNEPSFKRLDHAKSASAFRKSCKLGKAKGCQGLIAVYARHPDAIDLPQTELLSAAETACAEGSPKTCAYLASLYFRLSDSPQMHRKGADIYERSCKQGSAVSCRQLAAAYRHGRGRKRDPERAFGMYEKLCRDDKLAGPCHMVGVLYAAGDGVEADDAVAAEYFEKACKMGDPQACGDYAGRLRMGWGIAKDEAKGFQVIERTCRTQKDAYACWMQGLFHLYGKGTPRDLDKAHALFSQACDDGEPDGCRSCGDLLSEHPTLSETGATLLYKRAVTLYQESCDRNHGRSCGDLAELYKAGDGVTRDPAHAAKLEEKACSLDPRECKE